MKPINRLTAVNLTLIQSKPAQLAITAFGEVNTGGWKNGTLVPRHYVVPPADGFAEYDFLAEPPTGIAIQVITPILAFATLTAPPGWLKGVRVCAQENKIETPLGKDVQTLPVSADAAADGAGPHQIALSMVLDPDVPFPSGAAVWIEGRFVDGWSFNGKAFVRSYDAFPVAGTLDVRADARSINEPDITAALQLAITVDGGTPHQLRVDTHNFFGHAEASYYV
jgi:hypothetical protein